MYAVNRPYETEDILAQSVSACQIDATQFNKCSNTDQSVSACQNDATQFNKCSNRLGQDTYCEIRTRPDPLSKVNRYALAINRPYETEDMSRPSLSLPDIKSK